MNIRFFKTLETLSKIEHLIQTKQPGVYMRFGDGDVSLACGSGELYQAASPALCEEMREAFAVDGGTIMKTLPLNCKEFGGFEEGMFPGKFEISYEGCLHLISRIEPIWKPSMINVYSATALAFAIINDTDRCIDFLCLFRDKEIIFVGNEKTPQNIRELLFSAEHKVISVPGRDSYDEIDRIETECLDFINQSSSYKVVITAMGCSGRVLQKRLWKKCSNIFLFDVGSVMDYICGWNTRAWMIDTNTRERFLQILQKKII